MAIIRNTIRGIKNGDDNWLLNGLVSVARATLGTPTGRAATFLGAGTLGGAAYGYAGNESLSPTTNFGNTLSGAAFGLGASAGLLFGLPAAGKILGMGFRANQKLGEMAYARDFAKNNIDTRIMGPNNSFIMRATPKQYEAPGAYRKFMSSPMVSIMKGSPRAMYDVAKGTAKSTASIGMRAGLLAAEHPGITASLAVGGLAASSYMGGPSSPTMSGARVNVDYNQQAIAAQEMGMGRISPDSMIGPAPQMMGPMHRAMQSSTYGLVQGLHNSRHG